MFDLALTRRLGERTVELAFASDDRVTGLVGVSGAGKTSVLNMIAGILRPDSGHVAVAGRTLFDAARAIDLPPEQRRCGYVFQDNRLFPHMSVRGNLTYGSGPRAGGGYRADLAEITALLGLEALLDRGPRTLSGGEAKRVAIGRALLSQPDFLLLDEPLTSIDPARRESILDAIERIRSEVGLPMLLVSHRADEVERIAGRIVRMAG